MSGFEVIEHTADVGVTASGDSLEDLFEQVTLGLLEITGSRARGPTGEVVEVDVQDAPDLGALLVDWLSEVLYLQDARDAVVTGVVLDEVLPDRVRGRITIEPLGSRHTEGTPVKAVTYHQLSVERTNSAWSARVFFDI